MEEETKKETSTTTQGGVKPNDLLHVNEVSELKKFARGKKMIPIFCNTPADLSPEHHKIFLEHFGFRKIKIIDDTFFQCKFPNGWKYHIPPKSSTWIYLVDNRDRYRGAIFFKMLERTRKTMKVTTFINYMTRYTIKIDRVVPQQRFGRQDEGFLKSPLIGMFRDGKQILYQTKPVEQVEKIGTSNHAQEEAFIRHQLYVEVEEYARSVKPEFDNISKYWEDI